MLLGFVDGSDEGCALGMADGDELGVDEGSELSTW